MRTSRRRTRSFDPLATPAGVRDVCAQLRARLPAIIPESDKQLFSLLHSVRHVNRYSSTDTNRGRPARWERETLLEVARHLAAILERETNGRVSISSFVGLYLRILHFPADVTSALERGEINLQEAMLLARLTHERLQTDARAARTIRRQVLKAHLETSGSQNQLRLRVQEMLGESAIVTSETLAAGVQKADTLLTVDPEDIRHLFFETMKDLFYALRSFNPDDLDEADIDEFMAAADLLSNTIHAIERRIRERRPLRPPVPATGQAPEPQPPIVERDAQGHITYRFN
jgi:hypothetical protein